jgi:HEAT repeat protein
MLFAFTLLLALQAGLLLLSLGAAVLARRRRSSAEERFQRIARGEVEGSNPAALAAAATSLIVDAPASRRAVIPAAAALRPLVVPMGEVLAHALGLPETTRGRRRREELIGSLLLLDYDAPFVPIRDVIRALFDRDPVTAAHAAWAVGRCPAAFHGGAVAVMSAARTAPAALSRTALWSIRRLLTAHPEQLGMMVAEPDPVLRALVVRSAGEVAAKAARMNGGPSAAPYLAICRAALGDGSEIVRATAARVMSGVTDATSVESLGAALSDRALAVQLAAAESLAASRHPWALMAIARHLVNASPAVRQASLRAVAKHRPDAPAELLSWLRDRDDQHVAAALSFLGATRPSQQTCDAVFELCTPGVNARILRAAAGVLASHARTSPALFRMVRNLDRLIAGLELDDAESVASFVEALALTGDERAIAPLMKRIPVSNRYIREKVVEGLALLEVRRAAGRETARQRRDSEQTVLVSG